MTIFHFKIILVLLIVSVLIGCEKKQCKDENLDFTINLVNNSDEIYYVDYDATYRYYYSRSTFSLSGGKSSKAGTCQTLQMYTDTKGKYFRRGGGGGPLDLKPAQTEVADLSGISASLSFANSENYMLNPTWIILFEEGNIPESTYGITINADGTISMN